LKTGPHQLQSGLNKFVIRGNLVGKKLIPEKTMEQKKFGKKIGKGSLNEIRPNWGILP